MFDESNRHLRHIICISFSDLSLMFESLNLKRDFGKKKFGNNRSVFDSTRFRPGFSHRWPAKGVYVARVPLKTSVLSLPSSVS